MTSPFYAIGDIHGHADKLRAAHELIERDRAANGVAQAPVVHLGDLVDRGPDSAGVIELLRAGQAEGHDWIVLMGNHDRMFLEFLSNPLQHPERLPPELGWRHPRVGGAATLASYGIADVERPLADLAPALESVPQAHRDWLAGLPLYHLQDAALCVHAGIRPGIDLHAQTEQDLIWIREPFLSDDRDHGVLVVHGHTAIDTPTHYGNRLNLDSSAGYGGPVSAAVIEGRSVWCLTDAGRERLDPPARKRRRF